MSKEQATADLGPWTVEDIQYLLSGFRDKPPLAEGFQRGLEFPRSAALTPDEVHRLMENLGVYPPLETSEGSAAGTQPAAVPVSPPPPPLDQELADLISHPSVVLITGHRDSGKTALAIRLLELLQAQAAPWIVGLPAKAARLLPEGFGLTDDPWEVPNNAVLYVPEAYRLFGARSSQSQQGRQVSDLVNLSRHRRQTLIFDVQNAAHVDRAIVSEVDVVLAKQPGPFHEGFERRQLSGVQDAARAAFAQLTGLRLKQAIWVVAPNRGIAGHLRMNLLPSCWRDALSRAFANARPPSASGGSSAAGTRRSALRVGKRTSPPELARRAKELRAAEYTFGQIAKALGISRTHANRLAKKPDGG